MKRNIIESNMKMMKIELVQTLIDRMGKPYRLPATEEKMNNPTKLYNAMVDLLVKTGMFDSNMMMVGGEHCLMRNVSGVLL